MARILIVDDDDGFRNMLRHLLEDEGHRVTEASDGLQAFKSYKEDLTDLIITDVFMPEVEGISLLVDLKRRHPDCKIIVVSGGGQLGQMQYLDFATQLGADHVLAKPFDPPELLAMVRDVLDVKKDARE